MGMDENDNECNFKNGSKKLNLAIPYFCGQSSDCSVLGSRWALDQALINIETFFPVVGVLEDLHSTFSVLQTKLPQFFNGVHNLYNNELKDPHKNSIKHPKLNAALTEYLKKKLNLEYELYNFLVKRLKKQREAIV